MSAVSALLLGQEICHIIPSVRRCSRCHRIVEFIDIVAVNFSGHGKAVIIDIAEFGYIFLFGKSGNVGIEEIMFFNIFLQISFQFLIDIGTTFVYIIFVFFICDIFVFFRYHIVILEKRIICYVNSIG